MDNRYLQQILDSMDGYHKDYYKECTLVDVLLSDSWNHSILVIFGKTKEELNEYEFKDKFAYRTVLHHPYIVQIEYPSGSSKEEIISRIQRTIDLACKARERKENARRRK